MSRHIMNYLNRGGMALKILHTRKQLLVFFMPGFLLGIIYVNLIAKKYMAEPGIFSEYFLEQFETVKIQAGEYIWYLLRLRLLPFLVLMGLGFTKMRRAAAVSFLLWTGISGGILISTSILSLGIRGSFLCMAGLFPQFLFYIPAYLVLIWHCYYSPQGRWNRQKTVFSALMLSGGMLLEMYVNPSIVRAFLSAM